MSELTWTPDTARLDSLELWERNPKYMTEARAKRLLASWEEMGQYQTLAIGPGGEVYDGHQRVKTLVAAGYGPDYEVRVLRASRALTEQERQRVVAESTVGTIGALDWDALASWDYGDLAGWGFDDETLAGWNDNAANLALMMEAEEEEPPEDPGAQVDQAEALREKWGVESGQMWRLGDHRIVCGDCTDAEVVARVMGGERANMVWTDPPYGVKYGANDHPSWRKRTIENDDLPADQLEELIRSAFRNFANLSVEGAAIYAACPPGTPLPTAIAAFVGSGFEFRWQLVWVKDSLVLGRADYHFRHENVLYGWKPDGAHYFVDDRKQDSVFEIPRPKRSAEHPTMKPPELVGQMIANSSKPDDVIADPFSGSGTTLIACERLGRKCRAVEIEPKYVAVALERWAEMTGKTPERVG